MLKAIEKYKSRYMTPENYPWVADMISDIECEIAERYIELPVDADGVPIKLGETIGEVDNCEFYTFTVEGYTSSLPDGEGELLLVDANDDVWNPRKCRHVKPRTLEDVLASYRFDAQNIYEDPTLDGNQRVDELEVLDGKAAAEIRELLGVS